MKARLNLPKQVKYLITVMGILTLAWVSMPLGKEKVGPARVESKTIPSHAMHSLGVTSRRNPHARMKISQGSQGPHDEAPSLQCFDCHGPHSPNDAADLHQANFEIPPHSRGPELSCAYCHTYDASIEELDPNGCVGCHERGGYPIAAAIGTLMREVGHPDVIPFIREVPTDCFICHRPEANLPLAPRLHRRHFLKDVKFVRHFRDGCIRCHSLAETGEIIVKPQPLQ